MNNFDSKALASAREVMALTRQTHIGGEAQLLAKIQCLFVEAMEYAAPQVEPVSAPYKLSDGVAAIRNAGIKVDADKIQAEREALNSPVIPDGWVMLPAEPTHAMMTAWLSEIANFRGHAAGYRAMIAAAPGKEG
ncbi:hypothetical protein ACJY8V_000979 [Escherichia coli]|nr:hypothetical protein [Escherichia coli]EFE3811418.1 hypothetical protein [Escherichia coli]EJF6665630.1 hypothetical protein [Escherichia coli]EJK1952101.1 hypothetical protein [Escherichia coli]HCN8164532.1 hypothetical protein [Escherichia coli]